MLPIDQTTIVPIFFIILRFKINSMSIYILGIESSCDDTSASIIKDNVLLSNVIAGQKVHQKFGGVVPELASRAHQQNIIPVVDTAIKEANITKNQISAIAYTRGPGLLGSLLVGSSFAKSFAMALNVPLIEIDHMQGHILAHFVQFPENIKKTPDFPFLCLTVSGGHTQISIVKNYFEMEIVGRTIDDAAGEAFDKSAKILGLPYPGGPLIDKYAVNGNPKTFKFSEAHIPELDYSFSGLKTSFLYFLRDRLKENPSFIEENLADLCASIQFAIVNSLIKKVVLASEKYQIKTIAVAGGVSANSALRKALVDMGHNIGAEIFIPPFEFTTDNAAMIAIAGYFKYLNGEFSSQEIRPYTRQKNLNS
jgi:N6-L-threonylcarbamoyladenine synthase